MKILQKILILLVIISMITSCEFFPVIPELSTTRPSTSTSTSTSTTTTTTTTKREEQKVLPEEDEGPLEDPYVGVSADEFYADYEPATSYMDAYYRTQHGFMSGSIAEQDQAPTIAEDQPTENGMLIRNTAALYSEDGNVYYVLDADGYIVNKIYRGGAYVTLEEVAAYLMAFGVTPPNYTSSKKTSPLNSIWGKYLRLNYSKFSGSTSKYPYEPELPDITGCGGNLQYYEIDIGTTGTDCDPAYSALPYNNGYAITRGAARIVFTVSDRNGNKIIDVNEKYLFYTYNHYNDFQEYLNYEGGWGEMFGNITGGGTLSSKYDCNPTPYVAVVRRDLRNGDVNTLKDEYIIALAYVQFNTKFYACDLACAA